MSILKNSVESLGEISDSVNWNDGSEDGFVKSVKFGLSGKATGLRNGLIRVNKYIHGFQQGRYLLVAADSGVGKTTLVDFMLINAWLDAKRLGRPFHCTYGSFEVSRTDKMARWCSYFIGILHQQHLPVDLILGRIEGRLLDEDQLELVKEGYKYVNEFMKDITFYEDSMNPTAIFSKIVMEHFHKVGTIVRAEPKKKGAVGRIIDYIPNDDSMYSFLVIDHLALMNTEKGLSLKQTMDRMSRYGVILKNRFKCSCIFIQQFSTDLLQSRRDSISRKDPSKSWRDIQPNRLDLGDSKATYRDADYVLGMTKPSDFALVEAMLYKCIPPSEGEGLGSFLIFLYVMKNKFGPADVICPLFTNPICGAFYDLPDPYGNEDELEEWYDRAKKLDNLCQLNYPKHEGR